MQLLNLTLPTAAENVALDEALLDAVEAGEIATDVLRLWEPAQATVVVGRSSGVQDEVHLEACREAGVPMLRRASGGAAIVTGPGCLMYAVVMSNSGRENLRLIDQVHRHVLGTIASALRVIAPDVQHLGMSDLALEGRKFSGNSVRMKRDHFLYHGTVLYGFDVALIGRLLKMPPRMPDYRDKRGHLEFVTNFPATGGALREMLARAFHAKQKLAELPQARMQKLVSEKYGREDWNLGR